MLYLEKRVLSPRPSIAFWMLGSGVTSFSIYLFTGLKSWTIRNVPSFFGTVKVECLYLELDRWIKSLSSIFWTHVWIALRPGCGRENSLAFIESGASFFKGIRWSHSLLGGNCLASFSEKTFVWIWYSGGMTVLTVSDVSTYFSAICCATVVFRISLTSICRMWLLSCSLATAFGVFRWTLVPISFPSPQLITGLNSLSHGYPKMACSLPRFVTKNFVCFCWFPYLM